MSIPIRNASSVNLLQNSGTVPQMDTALANWFQPISFRQITKTVINFQVVETFTPIDFRGVWQPFSPQQLNMRPHGQRKWKWFTVHSETNLALTPDDTIVYLGTRFRVMGTLDYALYAYFEYHLVQDYQGDNLVTESGDSLITEDGDEIIT